MNHLLGAVCMYLLMGVIWALGYSIVHELIPGSFHGLEAELNETPQLLYFSFVALTTVGFGDATPVQPMARTLAMLEGVAGQLYMAPLVASLVGRHVTTLPEEGAS